MESYVISVSAGTGCYRHIQISAKATLYQLHEVIIRAFEFEDDREHAFFMDNRFWSQEHAFYSEKLKTDDRVSKKYTLKKLELKKGDAFKYLFDFGDEWQFQCKVLRELEERTDFPSVIRRVGQSPEQYPDYDDEEDEEEADYEPLTKEEQERLFEVVPLPKGTIYMIRDYLTAAANLYGLVTLDKLYDLYNSQNAPISPEDFFIAVSAISHGENEFAIVEPEEEGRTAMEALQRAEVAGDYLFVDDPEKSMQELRRLQRGKTYKVLPQKEFLKYTDDLYFPSTPQQMAMLQFLMRKKKKLQMTPVEFCGCIQSVIRVDAPFAEIIRLAQDDGLSLDHFEDMEKFVDLLQNLNNSTPKHANCGYTPNETFAMSDRGKKLAERNAPKNQMSLFDAMETPIIATISGTPSRNAPCPCGSGRKYKNCCGKGK